jgi:hypothetical protein
MRSRKITKEDCLKNFRENKRRADTEYPRRYAIIDGVVWNCFDVKKEHYDTALWTNNPEPWRKFFMLIRGESL